MWVEWEHETQCHWVYTNSGVYSLMSGTPGSAITFAVAKKISHIQLVIPSRQITPRFLRTDKTTNWLGRDTTSPPEADWVYPTRTVEQEQEFLIIDSLPYAIKDFIQECAQQRITVEIDFGYPRNDDPGIVIDIGDTDTHVSYVHSLGVPLTHAVVPTGIDTLRSVVTDYTRVSNPDSVLTAHGFHKTHYDPELLTALVGALKEVHDATNTIAQLHKAPYQHPWLRHEPQWIAVHVALPIPGLHEYLAAATQKRLHVLPRDMSVDFSLTDPLVQLARSRLLHILGSQ